MKKFIKFGFAGIFIVIAVCALFGAAVMLLWNALMPQIFALQQINYPQAVGLLVLARILSGGFDGGRRGFNPQRFHKGKAMREKWMDMSEEEREEFLRGRRDFFRFHEFFNERSNGCKKDAHNGEAVKENQSEQ